jgi:hypothetical protein
MDNIEELEKLKNKTNVVSEDSNTGSFIKQTLISIRKIGVYFILGGLVLYICKLNKLVVFPTDIDKEPFTMPVGGFMDQISKTMSSGKDKGFIPDQKTSELVSSIFDNIQNISFNVENKPYTILKSFAEYKQSPKSNFFANFIIAQLESLLSTNYSMFTSLFTFMDETFNDTMVVLLGPIITIFFSMFVVFVDYFYIIYGWFSNLHWLFKRNTNNTKSGLPVWETPIFSIYLFFSWNFAVALNILFFFSLPWLFSFPMIQISLVVFTLISLLSFKGSVNETPVNSINFLYKHFIKNYKRLISIVLTLSVVVNSYNILGASHGVFGLFIVLLIYFTTNLYKPFVYGQTTTDVINNTTPSATRPPALNPGYVPEADLVVTSPPMATDVRIAPNSVKNELLPQATQVGGKQNILKMLKTLNNKYYLK